MARPFSLTICETSEELQHRLHSTPSPHSYERLLMLWWLKSQQVSSREEIATRLSRSVQTISRWLGLYRQGGLEGLLEVKTAPGQPPAVTESVLEALLQQLESPEGFTSYKAIQKWLEEEFELQLAYTTVHQLVRYRLKAKLKRPRPYSNKQDEKELNQFKKTLAIA